MNNNNTKVSSWNIILSLVILLALSLITIIAIIVVNVKAVDEDTRINIESYVSAIIQDKLKNQATLTKDYAYWDATIKNAYLSQDKQWIKNNIGQYLTDTFSVTDVYIIDKNDNPVLALN
ncbi:MAG: CHASE4 domain-containing protein, partial [Thiohalophilus sp.]